MTKNSFDSEQSRSGRDAGIESVLKNNEAFANAAGAFIINLRRGWKGTGEDIRKAWEQKGGISPKHHNAWGGVISGMVRRGILSKTGKRTQMIATKSHSRTTDIYTR